jgi:YebC/PmpR family DNA-binding regulatory protein
MSALLATPARAASLLREPRMERDQVVHIVEVLVSTCCALAREKIGEPDDRKRHITQLRMNDLAHAASPCGCESRGKGCAGAWLLRAASIARVECQGRTMGRIFETRKHTMFARWDRMAKAFTRVSKEIAIAVRAGGSSAEGNPALRRAIQNARAVNMPKDKIENAIKRAAGHGAQSYEEIMYEGYAPHGIAVLIQTATDNPTRTVANVRNAFTKKGGSMGATGSVQFLFKHMGVFRLEPEGVDQEELELDLIDHGLQDMGESTSEKGEKQLVIHCEFHDFGRLQKAIEDRGLKQLSAESEYIPINTMDLSPEHATEALELIDRLEQDDDVQKVFHNLA